MKKPLIAINVISLFPEFINQYAQFGIIARAIALHLLKWTATDLRQFGIGPRKTVDDRPFGGGVGMVLRPDVVYKAVLHARKKAKGRKVKVVMLTPQGKVFSQKIAKNLAKQDELIFVCGRYEGFDERVRKFADLELSIGDYILMGGELPALVAAEVVLRLVPGVLGKEESAEVESFENGLLEYPQYTKPEVWEVESKKLKVPAVLRSGHHANIYAYRNSEAIKRTKKRRPDLLQ